MGITFTNNWKNISDKLRSTLRTEFKGALPVFINDEPISTGGQFIQLDLASTSLLQKLVGCEIREYTVTMNYVYQNPNIKKSSLDHVLRYVSRIEQLMQNNISLSLADSTDAVNCRVESTTFEEGEDSYLVSFDYKCQHVSGLSEVISTIPTFDNIKSLLFDGSNTSLQTSGNNTLADATYVFWAKTSVSTSQNVFGHGGERIGAFYFNFFQNRPFLYLNTSFWRYWDDTSKQDDGQWHHWAVYVDADDITNCKLYCDGVLQNVNQTKSTDTNANSYTQNLTIGARDTSAGGTPFTGNIDEFAWFNTELASYTIRDIYNNGKPNDLNSNQFLSASKENLQAYWRMGDNDTFPTIKDNSRNSYDATMTNMDASDIEEDTP